MSSRTNYMTMKNTYWFNETTREKISYKDEVRVYVTKQNQLDKRTKEYKELLRDREKGFILGGEVGVELHKQNPK